MEVILRPVVIDGGETSGFFSPSRSRQVTSVRPPAFVDMREAMGIRGLAWATAAKRSGHPDLFSTFYI
jgi:hypothetical protein